MPPGHRHPTDTTRASAAELSTFTRSNLLDNWYFVGGGSQLGYGVFPVNQRGQSSYNNSNAYTIDRWKLTNGSLTLANGGIILNGTIEQILPVSIGLPVVASALFSDGTMTTPSYNDSTRTFTLTATGQTIVAVKLEVGDTQTLAHQESGSWVLNEVAHFNAEQQKCFAYFYRPGFNMNAFGFVTAGATKYYIAFPVPVPMARRPSLIGNRTWLARGATGYSAATPTTTSMTNTAVAFSSGTVITIVETLDAPAGDTNNSLFVYEIAGLALSAEL